MNICRYSRFVAIAFLLFSRMTFLSAQEDDLFKQLFKQSFKESLKSDLLSDPSLMRFDSSFYKAPLILDVNKNPIFVLGYDRELNALFRNFKDSLKSFDPSVPSSLAMEITDWYKYDPNSTETAGETITNAVLVPIMSILSLDIVSLFDYLIRAQVIPYDDPIRSRKKERYVTPIKYSFSEGDKSFIIEKTNQMIWAIKMEEWDMEKGGGEKEKEEE